MVSTAVQMYVHLVSEWLLQDHSAFCTPLVHQSLLLFLWYFLQVQAIDLPLNKKARRSRSERHFLPYKFPYRVE